MVERRHHPYGFTLIELTVTSSMLVILTAAGLAMFSAGTRAAGKAKRQGAMISQGQAAMQAMARDIRVAVKQENLTLTALDAQDDPSAADTIDFVMVVEPRLGGDPRATTIHEVGYYIDQNEDTPQRGLVRRDDDTLDDEPLGGGRFTAIAPNAVGLKFVFYDGLEWKSGWDDQKTLPQAVQMTLVIADEKNLETPMVFTTTVTLINA